MDEVTELREQLLTEKQAYNSAKQSLYRMSTRLRKLCKRLEPTEEIVKEMQAISVEIRDLARLATHD